MNKLTTLLHPTDFSDSAHQAVIQAARLAGAHGAVLHLLHVVLLHEEDPVQTERRMQDVLSAAASEGAGRVESAIVRGTSPYETIAERADELKPQLIVLGTHGRRGIGRFLMGSDAEKVLRHASCDVMTLRADARPGGADGRFHRVLVPVDFSDHSRRALARARGLASGAGDAITLLHVVEPLPPMYFAGGLENREQLDPDLPDRVKSRLEEWAGAPPVATHMTEGHAAKEVVRTAEEIGADLIAIGTRGLTGLDHMVVGSVTERVCRSARVPVLVTR